MRVRLNLSDAVHDLAPTAPLCFCNRATWLEYLKSAAASQNHAGEPKVILVINGEPSFNRDFNFCEDCTQIKSVEMIGKSRCDPLFLKRASDE